MNRARAAYTIAHGVVCADGARTITALPVGADGRFNASVKWGVADNELIVVAIDRSGHTSIIERAIVHIF